MLQHLPRKHAVLLPLFHIPSMPPSCPSSTSLPCHGHRRSSHGQHGHRHARPRQASFGQGAVRRLGQGIAASRARSWADLGG
jgi:hypothetical protein